MKFDNLTTLFIFISCLKVELFFSLPVNSETLELSTVLHLYFRRKIVHLYFLTEFMKERKQLHDSFLVKNSSWLIS